MDSNSNTARNSKSPPGKPFQKNDPRINRKGRPKSFDAWRALSLAIAHEAAQEQDETGNPKPIEINGHIATNAEMVLRRWWTSRDIRMEIQATEIAFGKVPDNVEVSGPGRGPMRTIAIALTDAERDAYIAEIVANRERQAHEMD